MIIKERNLEAVANPYGNNYLDNANLIHAEGNYKTLKAINDGKIPYFAGAYGLLAHTFEQMYKGYIEAYADAYPDCSFPIRDTGHRLEILADRIDRNILPIIQNVKNKPKFLRKLAYIADGYTRSQYHDFYDLAEFRAAFFYYSKQRTYLYGEMERILSRAQQEEEKYIDLE